MNDRVAKIEALLFIHGEPLSFKKISGILGIEHGAVISVLNEYKEKLSSEERGLALVIEDEKVQLVSKPEFSPLVQAFVKEELEEELTPASLETISIISYLGPIARSRIDYLRGVNSSFILRSLLLRGLIEKAPDPQRSNSYRYFPSFDLLRHLGIQKREDLPDFSRFRALISKFGPVSESKNDLLSEKI